MTSNEALPAGLTLSGKPMSSPLQDVRAVSRRLVGHFVDNVIPCGTLPGDIIAGDVTTITRFCLRLSVSMLDGQDIPAKTDRLAAAAAGWAREGVPIDTILHAIHEGFKVGMDLVLSNATANDYDNLVGGAKLVVEMLDTMNATVARAYVREHRAAVSEHHTAVHTLTSALLAGCPTSTMARECGIAIADAYFVLALDIPMHPDERHPMLDGKVVARRKLRRLQTELGARCGEDALALLSVDGGTILLPTAGRRDEHLDELLEHLSAAARVSVTAAVVTAAVDDVPGAADRAHEVLDMVQRLHCVPGLYRFTDMALEYQLTRPGPGREALGSLLDPLDSHPELLDTLLSHIANNLNRQRTARELHIHTNTVDYRLRRIGQLTGLDPTVTSGLWQLRSAIIARSFTE
ncbi:carbohydrate diacid transcriptional activator CdaR [Nocardia otitidiscaviarum]|uniref:Carbohydrate diacid transcriptional activator CdaR n=1 Tax=Nocardia otitidiscaviarum TaxID=1823 RepID=A0A378YST2_9NOCA|nr:helix-turn-helix domain-containing protein [Nocardia otitidiscaviarum]SUA79833.1 carbohydrate diacid transcriptional activator CdaR [Nocardia otitidiscaviarum]